MIKESGDGQGRGGRRALCSSKGKGRVSQDAAL